jgi:hypothetical protein
MSNVNGIAVDSDDIEICIPISGNKFQEQHCYDNGKPMPTSKELMSSTFTVKISTQMMKFMKELVFPIFNVPRENNDYLISLQTEEQPQEIFDQENMNEKTISEVGIKPSDALTIMIVHKDYNNWSPPSSQPRRKSKRITKGRRRDKQRLLNWSCSDSCHVSR